MSLNPTTPFAMQKEVDSSAVSESKSLTERNYIKVNLILKLLGLFPGEALVGTKMTELGGLVVQRLN